MKTRGFTEDDVPSQAGRIALVTGANTGIGFHVARVLAERGARVLLGCRSAERAEAAVARIRRTVSKASLEIVRLDLGDLASVEAAADRVLREPKLDLLINNPRRSKLQLLYNQTSTAPTTKELPAIRGINELPPDSRFRVESVSTEERVSSVRVVDFFGDEQVEIVYCGNLWNHWSCSP